MDLRPSMQQAFYTGRFATLTGAPAPSVAMRSVRDCPKLPNDTMSVGETIRKQGTAFQASVKTITLPRFKMGPFLNPRRSNTWCNMQIFTLLI